MNFRLRWRHVHHVSLATLAMLAVAVFFVVGAVLRLAMGPVSLGPFSGQLRDAVLNALPGLAVRYDDAALEWSRDESRINLIIVGARIFDSNRRIIAQAPKAEIGLAAGSLIQGHVEIRRIALVGVQLTLVRTKDGKLHLGVEGNGSGEDVLERIRQAIEKSGDGPSTLDRFEVRDARLAFYDQRTGLFLVAPRAEVAVASDRANPGSPLTAAVEADVEVTGQPAHVTASIKVPKPGRDLTGDVSVRGLELTALARNSPRFAFLQPFDLRTDVSGSFVVQHSTRLQSADLSISATGIVGGFGSPLKVQSFRFIGRYDGATGRILVDDSELQGTGVSAHAQGLGNLKFGPDGSLARADLDLNADKIGITMPSAFQQAVTIGGVSLRGSYTTADQTFTIEHLLLTGSPLAGALSGRVVLAQNKSPAFELRGKIDPLSVRDLVRYWPLRVGQGAREWIAENMPAGIVGPATINAQIGAGELDQPALPEAALNLAFPVTNASVRYVRGMTLLANAKGSALLT
ncbi:MAG: hypothetical protein JO208_08175, partial [Alphaproteobacteria bacterium]|nr:hypothetical protein [Alphaproteobacteria bacterium]